MYLGPGQLTSLEISLIWIGLAVFVPLLDLIARRSPRWSPCRLTCINQALS